MYVYTLIPTVMGWVTVLSSKTGITRLGLPRPTEEEARLYTPEWRMAKRDDDCFRDLAKKIQQYFEGKKVNFNEDVDIEHFPFFSQNVWRQTKEIPYGRTGSYAEIALKIGKPLAPRAVGQALGRNPIPIIIPCHRVIKSDGSLGGFSGGLNIKDKLLQLEAVAEL